MADPILTNAEAAMASMIVGMTTDGGYNYDWETVNHEDFAKSQDYNAYAFPRAMIYLEPEERNTDDPDGAWAGAYHNEAMFRIRVVGRLDEEYAEPLFEINKVLNKGLDDLKKLFGTNYSLNGTIETIMYRSSNRVRQENGDIMIPKVLDTFWMVRYSQDRTNPTELDP